MSPPDRSPAAGVDAPSYELAWKPDWPTAMAHHVQWWHGEGLVLHVDAPRAEPRLPDPPAPEAPPTVREQLLDPDYRARFNEHHLARAALVGDTVPHASTNVGAGDLAAMLGAGWRFTHETVWYEPVIDDPENHPPLSFDPGNGPFRELMAMTRANVERAAGRYLVGITDIIENIDILSAMRDPQTLMMDLIERPAWVRRRVDEINLAYFDAFDRFYELTKDPAGGNVFAAFNVWGPGKSAKVQCDACAMFSPAMFREFVTPALTEQCRWLDFSMYHLDGPDALVHVDELLAIEPLHAIEWTPGAGQPGGGDPCWFDLYRRIKAGGKSVQAIGVRYDQVIPLLDAVGPDGMYLMTNARSEDDALALVEKVEAYRK